jgi:hypothetical protein
MFDAQSRLAAVNPDHHLWRNGRYWWVAFTLIHDGWRQERVRRSLKTADVVEARRRRDVIFGEYDGRPGTALSLRFTPAPAEAALRAA